MNNIIFNMTLCGSIGFLSYLFLRGLMERSCDLRWQYIFIKMIMFFFVFPLPIFSAELKYQIQKLGIDVISEMDIEKLKNCIVIQPEATIISYSIKIIYVILIFMAIISIGIIGYHLYHYLRLCYYIKIDSIPLDKNFHKQISKIQTEMKVKNVRVLFSKNIFTPIAMGFFRPVIVLPICMKDKSWNDNWEFIIRHELTHIKNFDIQIRFLVFVIVAVHWYNPLCYKLLHEVNEISELYCDFVTTKNYTIAQKKKYGYLILEVCKWQQKKNRYFLAFAKRNKNFMLRRIEEMANQRKKKIFTTCLLATVICAAGTASAISYESPMVIRDSVISSVNTQEIWTNSVDTGLNVHIQNEADCRENIDNHAICWHKFEDTTRIIHSPNSKGGCTLTYREASVCVKCNETILGDVLNVVEFQKCIHNN